MRKFLPQAITRSMSIRQGLTVARMTRQLHGEKKIATSFQGVHRCETGNVSCDSRRARTFYRVRGAFVRGRFEERAFIVGSGALEEIPHPRWGIEWQMGARILSPPLQLRVPRAALPTLFLVPGARRGPRSSPVPRTLAPFDRLPASPFGLFLGRQGDTRAIGVSVERGLRGNSLVALCT